MCHKCHDPFDYKPKFNAIVSGSFRHLDSDMVISDINILGKNRGFVAMATSFSLLVQTDILIN